MDPDDIACPDCGETDRLAGRRDDPGDAIIHITCGACGTVWDRDTAKRCPRCDSSDLYVAPVAVIEKARGTQLSIVSTTPEYLCWSCDRDLIDAQRRSGTALMPDQLPTIDPATNNAIGPATDSAIDRATNRETGHR